jgi:hypothetical protein
MNNNTTLTRSESASHNGQPDNDTNTLKKYEATLNFAQHSRAKVIIEAASLEEAEEKAGDICADEIDDWNPYDGEVNILDVSPVEGGQDND